MCQTLKVRFELGLPWIHLCGMFHLYSPYIVILLIYSLYEVWRRWIDEGECWRRDWSRGEGSNFEKIWSDENIKARRRLDSPLLYLLQCLTWWLESWYEESDMNLPVWVSWCGNLRAFLFMHLAPNLRKFAVQDQNFALKILMWSS